MRFYSLQNSLQTYSLLTTATTNQRLDQVRQIIVTAVTLGHALYAREETAGQPGILKKNMKK